MITKVEFNRKFRLRKEPHFREVINYPMNFKLESPQELSLCLNWILSNAIDKFDDPEIRKVEWYDFIWTITRKIRQRVNQFQLNDLYAVHLLEIITRFHIFSLHSMVDVVALGFDEHLNTENLTKCLITLNQLYNDLNFREIYCANEEEFRTYIALYFHGGELQRNAYRLDSVMRRTPKLQFALECILALNSNNYIKFFNLVREADFLTACVLYRQFHDARLKALMALNKSHRPFDYPKVDLMKHLGFENVSDVDIFCHYIGIETDENFVNFNPKNNLKIGHRPANTLHKSLIEYKRKKIPLSELFAGGKFEFGEKQLASLGFGHNRPCGPGYRFNDDDDLIWRNDHVPMRIFSENIVAEQMWKSIFFSVVNSIIADIFERTEIREESLSGVSSCEEEKPTDRIQYISHSIDKKAARNLPPMPGFKILMKQRRSANFKAPQSQKTRDSPKESITIKDTKNRGIAKSQEAIQDTDDSVSEATEQASSSEILSESENSISSENAGLKPPDEVESDSDSPTPSASNCDNPEFEAVALSSIMNKVLKVYRKRGRGRKHS